MKPITLYDPTPLIRLALDFKHVDVDLHISKKPREILADIKGPALTHNNHVLIGEPSVLGWIDRRFPAPTIFPHDLEVYTKAATLAHAIMTDQAAANELWKAFKNGTSPFLTGPVPNIADLALITHLDQLPASNAARDWPRTVMHHG